METVVALILDALDDVAATVKTMFPPLRIILLQSLFLLVVCGGLVLAIGGLALAFVTVIS